MSRLYEIYTQLPPPQNPANTMARLRKEGLVPPRKKTKNTKNMKIKKNTKNTKDMKNAKIRKKTKKKKKKRIYKKSGQYSGTKCDP